MSREENLLRSVTQWGWGSRLFTGGLAAIFAWGVVAYIYQLQEGLAVTAMREYVSWGLYITNFVFFIGISHVGALMSAILRITHAEWRKSITRMAEAITFSSLFFGALMPIVDLGRPDRILNLFLYPRFQSPILWDLLCIFTYLVGSTLFLYLPMIPDIAYLRDRVAFGSLRRLLCRVLALNWQGTASQHTRLERAMGIMAVLIIPIAVSVHTVVSWIFGMTLRPGWNSTIFGPYFVAGALVSGAASVVVAMATFRKAYHLEEYITFKHFRNMALLVLTLDLIYIYFNVAEYLTLGYKMETAERELLTALFGGEYAFAFWLAQIGGLLLPALLLILPHVSAVEKIRRVPVLRPIPLATSAALAGALSVVVFPNNAPPVAALDPGIASTMALVFAALFGMLLIAFVVSFLPVLRKHAIATFVCASALIVVQAWVKRYLIVVPTLLNPYLPIQNVPAEWTTYIPTWVEWSITAGAMAGFVLLYTLFSKFFPIVSMWETREERHAVKERTAIQPEMRGAQ
jgi:molybdopterin-containing oxidoreductase family membrane subunit